MGLMSNRQTTSATGNVPVWLDSGHIANIKGALKPGAYVARAYREARENNGRPPAWARKLANGRWEFDARYVHDDAARNLSTIGISEAARLLGTSRPTIQAWVDRGIVVSVETTGRTKGASRSILREPFMQHLHSLRERLGAPAVHGRRQGAGKPASSDPIDTASAAVPDSHDDDAVLIAARNAKAEAERNLREAERKVQRCNERVSRRDAGLDTARKASREAASALAKARREAKQISERVKKAEKELAKFEAAREKNRRRSAAAAAMSKAEKAGRAAAIEAELRAAIEKKRQDKLWEERAAAIAARVVNDMFDDRLDRIQAMSLFNRNAAADGIPDEIRIRVRKNFFGR